MCDPFLDLMRETYAMMNSGALCNQKGMLDMASNSYHFFIASTEGSTSQPTPLRKRQINNMNQQNTLEDVVVVITVKTNNDRGSKNDKHCELPPALSYETGWTVYFYCRIGRC